MCRAPGGQSPTIVPELSRGQALHRVGARAKCLTPPPADGRRRARPTSGFYQWSRKGEQEPGRSSALNWIGMSYWLLLEEGPSWAAPARAGVPAA